MTYFLVCLLSLVTVGSFCAARAISRRGKAKRHQRERIALALQHAAEMRRYPRYGSSSGRAPNAGPSTATSTTRTTGGSSRPVSDAHGDNLAPLQVPISEGPYRNLSPWPGRARTGVQRSGVQHNPRSARIDASSRKQFGMCDYPDEKGTK